MDGARFDQSLQDVAPSAARRHALRSLSAAGMAILIGLGLTNGGDARNAKNQSGTQGRRPGDAQADGKGKGKGKGKRGPAGPSGNQGPTGPTGPTGPAPASVIRFGPENQATGSALGSTAECQPGEHAVGGGYFLNFFEDQSINFLASNPLPLTDGAVPTAWKAEVNTVFPGGDKSIKAFVICVPD